MNIDGIITLGDEYLSEFAYELRRFLKDFVEKRSLDIKYNVWLDVDIPTNRFWDRDICYILPLDIECKWTQAKHKFFLSETSVSEEVIFTVSQNVDDVLIVGMDLVREEKR